MFGKDNFIPVIDAVDLLRAEMRELRSGRLRFRIVRRFRPPGAEVLAIFLLHRGREYQLRLSPAMLLLADYLLRHSRCAQTASQIATGMHEDSFYSGYEDTEWRQRTYRIPRSAIKEYTKRLRRALAVAFADAHLRRDPRNVLVGEGSVSNHVLYRWLAVVEIEYIDSTATDDLQALP